MPVPGDTGEQLGVGDGMEERHLGGGVSRTGGGRMWRMRDREEVHTTSGFQLGKRDGC